MANTCYDTNLLNNSGTNQAERALSALQAAYAKVDERSLSDLILFLSKYSAYLNYYDLSDTVAGDWRPFMQNDVAVAAATIAALKTQDYVTYVTNLYAYVMTPTTGPETPSYPDPALTFKYIFDLVASVASQLNQCQANIPSDADYQPFLTVAIGSKLAVPLHLLADYYSWLLVTVPLVPISDSLTDVCAPVDTVVSMDALNFLGTVAAPTPWTCSIPAPNPLYSIYYDPGAGVAAILRQIISDPIFTGTVDEFLNGVAYVVAQTGSVYLTNLLTSYPKHTPHYALVLSFLQLFESAQAHLNQYTGRHLHFYYQKVLQLKPNRGVPDTAHIVFTLQKNTTQHPLKKGTSFKAGKDGAGNSIFYALDSDIVINQAGVQALRSLFLLTNAGGSTPQQLYASPVANSADGQGAKLISPDQSWFPFGDLNNGNFTAAGAAIGFGISSNVLFLNEGVRKITLNFPVTDPVTGKAPGALTLPTDSFSVQFTGPKNWFNATDFGTVATSYAAGVITLSVQVPGKAPAIIPYSVKLHGSGGIYPQALPMMKVLLTSDGYASYSVIKSLTIGTVTLTVEADSIQNLSLQNDDGKIDASKPFKPFGEFPDTGSSFIIGSKEIFQKPLTSLSVNVTWVSGSGTKIIASILEDAAWQPDAGSIIPPPGSSLPPIPNAIALNSNTPLLGTDPVTGAVAESTTNHLYAYFLETPVSPVDFTTPALFTRNSSNGFINLVNQDTSSSLSTYIGGVATAIAHSTTTVNQQPPTSTNPNTVYTFTISNPAIVAPNAPPLASGINLCYTAQVQLLSGATAADYNGRAHFFYHIEPFGFREMHPYLFTLLPTGVAGPPDNQMNFLPVFNLDDTIAGAAAGAAAPVTPSPKDDGSAVSPDNGGELWIGLNNAIPGETHSILFQVSEGSSNPLKDPATVTWYYLSANNWIPLPDTVVDATNNLSQSGLVLVPLPGDETKNNTRADAGLVWIKAAVAGNTDAVCRIVAIQTNAAAASFVPDLPHNIDFTANIAANTISKLVTADGAIKQLVQPYPSFGGAPAETGTQFNLRVSERLRHKHRAWTTWDYERLVLQQFSQQIHKVKCLNHTLLDTTTQAYSELAPGHVLVVTIPDLKLLTGANPYLPFTNTGLLEQVKKFLSPLISMFVTLEVQNPQFEGIQIVCNVNFKAGYDKNFYTAQLNTDIMNFLMPWATGSTTQDINFGGSIEKSSLINFVQTREYVDFTTCFKMYQYIYGEKGFVPYQPGNDLDVAVATTARSVFVPYYVPGTPPTGNIINATADCNCNDQ
jgi:hypothetical protein